MLASCLGKIPTHGDFVRVRAGTDALQQFDDWVQSGVRRVREGPSGSTPAREEAPIRRFVFGSGAVLVGVLRASCDEQGRRYPFAVVSELPANGVSPPHRIYLPVQCRLFFNEATSLVRRATTGKMEAGELRTRLERLPKPRVQPIVPRRHKQYLRRETVGGLEETLRNGKGDEVNGAVFSRLVRRLRKRRDSLKKGVRCPLIDRGQPAGSLVSFWTALAVRRTRFDASAPTLFWTPPAALASRSDLLLYPGSVAPRVLEEVLSVGAPSNNDIGPRDVGTGSPDPDPSCAHGCADARLWNLLNHS